ncbi:MAG: DNA polymerase Y family protein [Acidimicrobiia bacterium]|nr:DNA polymerase Y family protein [Acidimicrobiia bacterium]NNL48062.1 DNA polymerase Y family protein [Acidimicrobiia bacterium]
MARILCVWFPDWALRRPDAPPDSPAQVINSDNRVTGVNQLAATRGLSIGMRRREAEAMCPEVVTLVDDQAASAAAFEPVACVIEDVVATVEVVHPGLALAPIAGAVSYYGSEADVVQRVHEAVKEVTGGGAHVGVARGPFAARHAAQNATPDAPLLVDNDADFLALLDIEVVGHEDLAATFRWLGVATLGELARLPRAAIASRFGTVGLVAHQLASGEDRNIRPSHLEGPPIAEEKFEDPITHLEQVGFVARSMMATLKVVLASEGASPHAVDIEAEAADGTIRNRTWRSPHPFTADELTERIRWQLHAWVAKGGIPGGLVRLRVTPHEVSDRGRQLALGHDATQQDEAHRALLRTQAVVGVDRVVVAQPQGGRDPAERVSWSRWGEQAQEPQRDPAAPWPGAIPRPAPALVPDPPPQLEVEWDEGTPVRIRLRSRWVPVLSWAGPWRKTGKWWEGDEPADRYQLVTSTGALLIATKQGRAYVLGIYD